MTRHLTDETKDMSTLLALIRTIDAEKRTHFAELRTGIGILTVPMSLVTILIATSDYYAIESVLLFAAVFLIGIVALSFLGAYIVIQSLKKIREDERLRKSCKDVAYLVEEYNSRWFSIEHKVETADSVPS